ncbi:MAG: DUF86 domain-containing protein [Opitutaceae bacterium]|jgi:uncharacterized protein with HEPN domain|nr:DUF86 domain-containing protein [Opitutaceae bacterium]
MKGKRDYGDYLRDILEHAEAAEGFLAAVPDVDSLAADRRTFWALIRALEVIGEAARHLPPEFRALYPEVPWRGMTGMRDKVIHDYFGVDATVVWRTVKEDLPAVVDSIRGILHKLEKPSSPDETRPPPSGVPPL